MKSIKSIHYLLILLSFFLSSVSAFEFQVANAREHVTYEDFIHMDQKSKYETIQIVMEYITLLEGQGPKAEIGPQKMVNVSPEDIKKIWNFLIQSAYANDSTAPLTPVLSIEEMQANSKHLCIYGGWVSFHDPVKNVCVHPTQIASRMKAAKVNIPAEIKTKLEDQQKQYISFAKKSCAGTGKLACSPSYFGTQDEQGSSICVDGDAVVGKLSQSSNNLKNVNTSLQCMLKVNEETKDGKNPILDRLIKNIETPDGAKNFSTNLQLMYSSCLCGDGKFINESYNERIFLHRTCYGIILQTESLLKNLSSSQVSCKELSDIEFSEIANMTDFTTAVYKSIRDKFKAEDYSKFAKNDYNDKGDKDYIEQRKRDLALDKANGLCPIDFGYNIKLELKPLTGQNKYLIIATPQGINADRKTNLIKWEVGGKYDPTDDPTQIIVPQTETQIKVKVTFDIGKKPSDEGEVPPLNKKTPALTVEKESDNEDGTQTLKAKITGMELVVPKFWKWSADEPGKATPDEKDPSKAVVPVLDKPYKVTVKYQELTADYTVEPNAACTIEKTSGDDAKNATFKVSVPKGMEKEKITWEPTASAHESKDLKDATYNDYQGQVITVKIGTISCEFKPASDGNDDNNKGLKIEAVTINETNLENEVKAIVTKDGTEGIPKDHTVRWFVKDVVKKEEPKKENKTMTVEEKEFAADNVDKATTPSDGVLDLGEGVTTKVKKLDTERKVYAKLYDKDGKEVATSNELPVDKIKLTPPPAVQTGPQRPNQVQPMKFNQPTKGQRGVY